MSTSCRAQKSLAGVALAVLAGATVAGCAAKPAADTSVAQAVTTTFDPANFGDPARGSNPYLPITPGTQSVRVGTTEVGGRAVPHEVTTTITDVYRVIDGVKTVLMLDHEVDGGQVTQESLDYVAEDKDGNVWLLGGYTEQYEGGRFVSALDSWMQGVNGAKAGILVQADPKVSSPVYAVAQPDQEEGDVAEVIKTGTKHCVPFDCYSDVLVVREGKASAPDNEFKYYARGVGQIDNVPRGDSVHKDVEQLENLTRLDAQGLDEFSKEALAVDHHAATQVPNVFDNGSASRG